MLLRRSLARPWCDPDLHEDDHGDHYHRGLLAEVDGHRVSAQSVTSDQHEDDPLVLLLDGEEIPVGVILRIALKVQELGVRQSTFHEN